MSLYVNRIKGKGRGVFSSVAIPPDQLVESCYTILVESEEDRQLLKATMLANYIFTWNEERTVSAIALGYGCLYNHSASANTRYSMNYETGSIEFYSIREIAAGEELTINYTGDPQSGSMTWFEERDIKYFD